MLRLARWLPHLSVLSLVALAFTMLPVTTTEAARTETRMVTNLIPDFDKGRLQRTSVGPDENSTLPNDGSITLSPVGYIDNWIQSAFTLPERVSDHGTVTVNGRIYIMGGTVFNPTANTKTPTANVWVGTPGADGNLVDPPGGTPAWQELSDLPPVPPSETPGGISPCAQTPSTSGARSSVAAAGFDTVSNGVATGGFIYAIGGALAASSGDPYSTSAVAIGKVAADGSVTWSSPPTACLPTMVQATSATIMEIQGTKYLYVVGGLSRTPPRGPLPIAQNGIKTTFVARINETTGDLSRFSDGAPGWDTGFDLPVPDTDPAREEGVWNATLVPSSGEVNGTTTFALYLMGGENIPGTGTPSDSARVYRGIIDVASKKVSWDIDIGSGPFNAALNQARSGLRAIVYDGSNVIVTGGKQGSGTSGAFSSVLSNQVDDQMELPVYGDGTVNFYESSNVLPEGRGRYNHGSVVVRQGTDKYVYVLGGVGNSSTNEGDQTNTIFYGKIVNDPNAAAGFAQNGWYYSDTYQIDISKARLLAVRWLTSIDRSAGPMDVRVEYRVNNNANQLESAWSEWFTAIDPQAGDSLFSKNGEEQNSSQLAQGLEFIFFEYRAYLTTSRPTTGTWKTPLLRSLGIEVEIPGFPNLRVPAVQPTIVDQQLRALAVTVANNNPLPQDSPLLSADEGSNGQFFVDVFVFKPGEPVQAPTIGQTGQVYAKLKKRDFPANATQVVSAWLDGTPGAGNTPYNITQLFTQDGQYTIYVIVDSIDGPFGYVQEADVAGQEGESDNIFGPLTITVEACPVEGCEPPPPDSPRILMPIISKS